MSALPVEQTTTLLHRWKVVAGAYAPYEEKFPDCEPPLLSSLAPLEDGRKEDSKYPNLLSPQARTDLGILPFSCGMVLASIWAFL